MKSTYRRLQRRRQAESGWALGPPESSRDIGDPASLRTAVDLVGRTDAGAQIRLVAGLQRTVGNAFVQRLVQRTAMFTPAAGTPPHEMTRPERQAFVGARFAGPDRRLAAHILQDIASARDPFVFTGITELESELVKRMLTSRLMRETQRPSHGLRAFGYPFTGDALYFGPRVNFAAYAYWTPLPPGGYGTRSDPVHRREIRHSARGDRYRVYGDPDGDYEWRLTSAGEADPYQALMTLFVPQPPHQRTLLHCDYLVSLVEYRAYAESIGSAAFNAAVAAFGPANMVLRWNAFTELNLPVPGSLMHPPVPGLGSLIEAHPNNEADLVIGDHVVFYNHPAYPALNAAVGNAWQLENAVLVERRGTTDIFLGHGSGERTEAEMRRQLAHEYNVVVRRARAAVARLQTNNMARRHQAYQFLHTHFPHVHQVFAPPALPVFHIQGPTWGGGNVDQPLDNITPAEVLGLEDPWNRGHMGVVRRPAEARP